MLPSGPQFLIDSIKGESTEFEKRQYRHARLELRNTISRAIAQCVDVNENSPWFGETKAIERRLRKLILEIPMLEEVRECGLSEWFFGKERMAKVDTTLDGVQKMSNFATQCLDVFRGTKTDEQEGVDPNMPEMPLSFVNEKMFAVQTHGPQVIKHTVGYLGIKLAITARLFIKLKSWLDKFLCVILMYLDITGFSLAIQDLTEALRIMFRRAWEEGAVDIDRYPDLYAQSKHQKMREAAESKESNRDATFEAAEECGVSEVVSAIVMIGGFFVYGKMPDKSETAKVIASMATKFQNLGKISFGVHGGIKLYQTIVTGINSSIEAFVDILCPEQSSLRVLDENKQRITEWMDAVNRLDREDTYIRLTCDPMLHREINMLRDQADEYSRIYQSLDYRPQNITALFMKSLNAIIRISNKATHISLNVGSRVDPFCVYLVGEPGVGKSFLSTELIHEVANYFKVPKFRRIYPRAMDEKFWSDYSQQFAVVIDDFGQLRDPVTFDPYAELIAIKSNVPKTVQMAEVSEKGRQFLSQMISISSNIAYPNPNSIQSKDALWRRRDCLIEVRNRENVDVNLVEIGQTSHLQFRFLHPVLENSPASEWMDYSALRAEVIRKAVVHLERQKAVASFLNRRDMEETKECGDSSDESDGEVDDYEHMRVAALGMLEGKEFEVNHQFIKVTPRSHYWYSTCGSFSPASEGKLFREFMSELSTSLARQYAAMNSPIPWSVCEYPKVYVGYDSMGFLNIPPWWIVMKKHYKVVMNDTEEPELIKAQANSIFRICDPFETECFRCDDVIGDVQSLFRYELCDGWYITGAMRRMMSAYENFTIEVCECGLGEDLEAVVTDVPDEEDVHPTGVEVLGNLQRLLTTEPVEVNVYATKKSDKKVCFNLTIDRCIEFECISKCAQEFADLEDLASSWADYLKVLTDQRRTLSGENICLRCQDVLFEEKQSLTLVTYESILSRMRVSVAKFMKEHPVITKVIAVTGAVAGVFAVYKLWAAFGEDTEEEQETERESEVLTQRLYVNAGARYARNTKDRVEETGNEYYRGEGRRVPKKPNVKIMVQERGGDPNAEQIIDNRIMPHVVRFEKLVDVEGELVRVYSQNAFQLVGKLFLVNAHALMKFSEGDYVRIRPRTGIEYVIAFRSEDCAFGKDGDVAIYNAGPSVPSARDSRGLICKEKDLAYLNNFPSSTIQIDPELRNYYYHADLKAHDVNKCTPYLDNSKIILRKIWTARINIERGECGGVSVAMVPQCPRKIVGIVSATFKNRPEGLFQIISQEMLAPLIAKFPQQVIDEGLSSLTSEKMQQLKIHEVAVEERGDYGLGNIEVLEQYRIRRVGAARGTRIRKSPLFDLFPHETEPSVLHARDPRMDEPIDPLVNGIKKYGSYHRPLPPRQLEEAYKSLEQEILMYAPLRPKVGVTTVEEAINGFPIKHYERIDMKSSPGIPYVYSRPADESGKAYLFNIAEDGHATVKSKMLESEIEERLKYYKQGKRYPSIWTNCLKDERRSLEKVRAGNTRTFIMAPVDLTIVFRSYFMDFMAAMIENRIHSFHAVGINADSAEWSLLYMQLEEKSEYGFDGDYGNWDGFLFATVIQLFARIANEWYNDGAEAALVRRTIMDEVIHTYSAYSTVLIVKNHGVPSGVPCTALLNSFGNALIIRTGYLCITFEAKALGMATRHDCSMDAYRATIKEVTFGDDHVNAVDVRTLTWFNQHTYSAWLTRYGIRYTDADKTLTNPPPFKKISECRFLKRGFVRDERFPTRIRAPIEMRTIQELINWVTDTLDPVEQLLLNYVDALRFLFHYGEDVFNAFRMVVDNGLLDLGILPPAYTYEFFQDEFDDTFV